MTCSEPSQPVLKVIALTVMVALAVLALSGCFGTGGDENYNGGIGAAGESEGFPGGPGQDDRKGDSTTTVYEKRSGQVTGINPGLSPSAFGHSPRETFEVSDQALVLEITITTEATLSGEDLRVELYPPGCERSSEDVIDPPSCTYMKHTENGEWSWELDEPEGGTWGVDLWRSEPEFGTIEWEMEAKMTVLVSD